MRNALRDPDGAINYVIEAGKKHPNRRDLCASKGQATSGATNWGPSPALAGTSFGVPSQLGGGATASFGRPSQLQTANTTFGQPAQAGQQFSAFGQPSQLAGRPFGGGLAAPSQNASGPFGQPAQRQGTPFAQQQSGALGLVQAQNNTAGFGQPPIPHGTSFVQPSQPAPFPTAGGFGRPSQPAPNQPVNTNLQENRAPTVAMGSSSGNIGQPISSSGHPNTNAAETSMVVANSSPSMSNPDGAPPRDVRSYSTRDPSTNKLLTWKGKPVEYIEDEPCFRRDDDGKWERIWFPDGPPHPNPDAELPIEAYDAKTIEAYLYFGKYGVWKDGWMPNLPPRSEWLQWDI